MTLKGVIEPPPFAAVMAGAFIQNGVLAYVWSTQTSFSECFNGLGGACWDDPWARQVVLTLALVFIMWLVSLRAYFSEGTSDPSIVDRLWSLLPWIYCWHFYLSASTTRGLVMAVLSSLWGARLTYNFILKGGFSGGEDYRWGEIRKWFKPGYQARRDTSTMMPRHTCHVCFLPFSARLAVGAVQFLLHHDVPAAGHPRLLLTCSRGRAVRRTAVCVRLCRHVDLP